MPPINCPMCGRAGAVGAEVLRLSGGGAHAVSSVRHAELQSNPGIRPVTLEKDAPGLPGLLSHGRVSDLTPPEGHAVAAAVLCLPAGEGPVAPPRNAPGLPRCSGGVRCAPPAQARSGDRPR